MLTLSKEQARRFILAHQGLGPKPEFRGKSGALDFVRRVGCIQYDPLNIVGGNSDLVLQARIPEYMPSILTELLYHDRKLLDGWDKNMSIYSTGDWPYFQRLRKAANNNARISDPIDKILPQIRLAIEKQGPLSSLDLNFKKKIDWSWAPARLSRAALESMYFWGELTIHHRIHTRRVYDFMSRHFSEELLSATDPNETEAQYHDWYVHRRLGSVGLMWDKAGDAWLGMSGIKSKERKATLTRLLKRSLVRQIQVAGISELCYVRTVDVEHLNKCLETKSRSSRAIILAPLDNLLWDRRFIKALFDFYYIWEVYKPAAERRFGYYVLPILYKDKFIARFEPGRDKPSNALIIKKWWWEPGIKRSAKMQADLILCFRRFLKYLGSEKILIEKKTLHDGELHWLNIQAKS
ncbi:winged helix-turn-helix domain-containing protein [bacterium]|nr:winged helix-turn-helix domain-containing protein [bacterium]